MYFLVFNNGSNLSTVFAVLAICQIGLKVQVKCEISISCVSQVSLHVLILQRRGKHKHSRQRRLSILFMHKIGKDGLFFSGHKPGFKL